MSATRPLLSIITPVHNEQDNVAACADAVAQVMAGLPEYDYEHIFVDNDSVDATGEVLRDIAASDSRVKVLVNSRNVGPFRNAAIGMKWASGDAVVPMLPADLQDPPQVIAQFLQAWREGSHVVYGVRTNRNESLALRAGRGLYYRILRWSGSGAQAPAHAGEFALIDRAVVDAILAADDQYPYIRGMIAQACSRHAVVEYAWEPRVRGKSKNSFLALLDQAANAFVTTSRNPARLALLAGLVIAMLGILYGLFGLIWLAFFSREGTGAGIPTIIVGVFVLGGLQLFFTGLIGEYLLSVHGQVRRTPPVFQTLTLNFDRAGTIGNGRAHITPERSEGSGISEADPA